LEILYTAENNEINYIQNATKNNSAWTHTTFLSNKSKYCLCHM